MSSVDQTNEPLDWQIEAWRGLLSVARGARWLTPYALVLVILRVAWSLRWLTSFQLAVSGLFVLLLVLGTVVLRWGTWSVTRREAIDRLVDRNRNWEPLRALVVRSDETTAHPYFNRKIREKVSRLRAEHGLFQNLLGSEAFLTALAVVCFVVLGLAHFVPRQSRAPATPVVPRLTVSQSVRLAGDTVSVSVSNLPAHQQPEFILRQASGQRRTVTPNWTGDQWRWNSFELSESMTVRARLGDRLSGPENVSVVSAPEVSLEVTKVVPPAYTELPERETPSAPVEVYPGSELTFQVRANRSMDRIVMRSDQRERVARQRRFLTFSREILDARTYEAVAVDTHGYRSDTVSLRVSMTRDGAPTLELREPDPEQKVEGSGLLPVQAWFNDDFGLSRARLTYWRAGDSPDTRMVPVPSDQSEGELYGQINRDALGLMTGDTFQFQLTAWDNDTVNGPKETTIGPFTMQVFSWAEMMQKRQGNLSGGRNRLSQMRETVEQLQSELQKLARDESMADWKTSRRLQEAQKTLENQQEQLRQAQKRVKQYQQGGNEGLSRESIRKLQNVRSMMKEYGMSNLQDAGDSLSRALKDQLENQSFSREDLEYSRKQLEKFERDIDRMHDFLEQAEPMLKMDDVARTLQSMGEEQKKWSRDGEWGDGDRRELERQSEQWEWMEKQLRSLEKQTSDSVRNQLKELRKSIESRNMAQRAQQMSRSSSPSEQQRERYSQQTREIRNRMRQTLQQQSARARSERRDLRARLVDYWTGWFAELQNWGRDLRTMEVPPRFAARYRSSMKPLNEAMSGATELRKGLAYLGGLTKRIGRMSTTFPRSVLQTIPEHEQRLTRSIKWIQQRRIGRARRAADVLQKNQARMIHRLLQWSPGRQSGQQQSSGSQGGQSLSQLMQQQRRLMQSMMPLMGGQKVSQSLAQQYLRQQRMIRRGLQQLAQQQSQNREVLGDLESITRSMREAEEKMSDREFDKTLESKQRTILKRLEQANKSLSAEDSRQRRRTEQRTAEPGGADTVTRDPSRYQDILERLEPDLSELDTDEREAVLRFYRYWFREREAPPQ
jgi:hypothetical protein